MRLLALEAPKPVVHIPCHRSVAIFIATSPSARRAGRPWIAIGCANGTIVLCSDDGKIERQVLLEHESNRTFCARFQLAWSPKGDCFAAWKYETITEKRQFLTLWTFANGESFDVCRTMISTGHTDDIESIAWSPDGTQIATGGFKGLRLTSRHGETTTERVLFGHTKSVVCLAWSSNGLLASGSDDTTVRVWVDVPRVDVPTDRSLKCGLPLIGHTARVSSVAWSPDGNQLASGSSDNTVRLWSLMLNKLGQVLHVLQGCSDGRFTLVGTSPMITSVAWLPNGHVMAGHSNGSVMHWKRHGKEDWQPQAHFHGHDDRVTHVSFCDGKVVSGCSLQIDVNSM